MLTLGQGRPRASSHAAQETAREKIQKGQGSRPSPRLTGTGSSTSYRVCGKARGTNQGAAPKQLQGTGLPHGPPRGGTGPSACSDTEQGCPCGGHPSPLTPRLYSQKHLLEECISKFTCMALNRPFFRVDTVPR